MFAHFLEAWSLVFHLNVIGLICVGTFFGIVVGSLPGLTPVMAMAIFSPMSFFMPPTLGIPFLLGLYKGGVYGGSISAILINTPGTATAAATAMDGYPLAKQGRAVYALTAALKASIIGDLVGTCLLVLVAPRLARVALKFGPPEIFSLILFSLMFVCIGQRGSLVKAWIATIFGIGLSFIGQDPITGYARFTFGIFQFQMGVELIALCIGLFGLSEILIQSEEKIIEGLQEAKISLFSFKSLLSDAFKFREAIQHLMLIIQSSIIGVVIGVLPGIGSETSCWIAYTTGLKRSKNPEKWGKGCIEGVLAPETANNIVCGTAMVPLLTFGIPGDVVTAVMLGAFIAQGLRPGPLLFARNPEIMLGIFITMYFATIAMFVLGHACIMFFVRAVNIKRSILYSVVIILCVAGTFAVRNSFVDLMVLVFSGTVGYAARKFRFPIPPILLGFILGGMLEVQFRRSVILGAGDISIFMTRPISAVFISITFAALLVFTWSQLRGSGAKKVGQKTGAL